MHSKKMDLLNLGLISGGCIWTLCCRMIIFPPPYRGFGFVTFADASSVEKVMKHGKDTGSHHIVDNKQVGGVSFGHVSLVLFMGGDWLGVLYS